jgi:uncharacterized membrane protein HdeD (DUF308 family)
MMEITMAYSMQATPTTSQSLRSAISKSIHDHWLFYFIEGLVLIVLGMLAVVVPPLASLVVEILVGWLFLIGGGVGLAMTLIGRHVPGFRWSLISAALAIVVGGVLIGWPAGGVLSLTLLLTAFFLVDGIASIMFAFEHRAHLPNTWGWLVTNGLSIWCSRDLFSSVCQGQPRGRLD